MQRDLHSGLYKVNAILGLQKDSVTPLGTLNDEYFTVKVLIDKAFCNGLISVQPNQNTATL